MPIIIVKSLSFFVFSLSSLSDMKRLNFCSCVFVILLFDVRRILDECSMIIVYFRLFVNDNGFSFRLARNIRPQEFQPIIFFGRYRYQ